MRLAVVAFVLAVAAASAQADTDSGATADAPKFDPLPPLPPAAFDLVPKPPEPPITGPTKIIAFRVEGQSKLRPRAASWLSHVDVGQTVVPGEEPQIEAALMSSELFESAEVHFEAVPGGVVVVCKLHDKHSWIAAPTAYILPGRYSVGGGFAESDLGGKNQKLLLYGQLGTATSLFLGAYLDPSIHGTKWQWRADVYLLHQIEDEYVNAPNMKTSFAVSRESTDTFLDAGLLLGYTFRWWLVGDMRFRGAYAYFRDAHMLDSASTPMPEPESDGWDWTLQTHWTLDRRKRHFGVTWGPYVQVIGEVAIPGLSTYQYQDASMRAYYSWKFFGDHELELRVGGNLGRHMPFHEEFTVGGTADLRGYDVDQFRGDTRGMARAEYSLPVASWRVVYLRAIGFFDAGYTAFNFPDPSGMRDYLPSQMVGDSWLRTDAGVGVRIYVSSIVLPLLGFDVAYGIEARAPQYYFEIGLTDF